MPSFTYYDQLARGSESVYNPLDVGYKRGQDGAKNSRANDSHARSTLLLPAAPARPNEVTRLDAPPTTGSTLDPAAPRPPPANPGYIEHDPMQQQEGQQESDSEGQEGRVESDSEGQKRQEEADAKAEAAADAEAEAAAETQAQAEAAADAEAEAEAQAQTKEAETEIASTAQQVQEIKQVQQIRVEQKQEGNATPPVEPVPLTHYIYCFTCAVQYQAAPVCPKCHKPATAVHYYKLSCSNQSPLLKEMGCATNSQVTDYCA
jgi:hypothetical protein